VVDYFDKTQNGMVSVERERGKTTWSAPALMLANPANPVPHSVGGTAVAWDTSTYISVPAPACAPAFRPTNYVTGSSAPDLFESMGGTTFQPHIFGIGPRSVTDTAPSWLAYTWENAGLHKVVVRCQGTDWKVAPESTLPLKVASLEMAETDPALSYGRLFFAVELVGSGVSFSNIERSDCTAAPEQLFWTLAISNAVEPSLALGANNVMWKAYRSTANTIYFQGP